MIQITDHLHQIQERVTQALLDAGRRDEEVRIVAVSKQQSADAIRALYLIGQRDFGESYLQEAVTKQEALGDCAICWHFIGRIQRNKTRLIAERFDWVHSLDRIEIARRLSQQRPKSAGRLNVLIQINQAKEPQKSGIAPDQANEFAQKVARLPMLELRGLMTIPPEHIGSEASARQFSMLRDLATKLCDSGLTLDTLSMGMSRDFEIAIANGANCVRIGAAIFGPRDA